MTKKMRCSSPNWFPGRRITEPSHDAPLPSNRPTKRAQTYVLGWKHDLISAIKVLTLPFQSSPSLGPRYGSLSRRPVPSVGTPAGTYSDGSTPTFCCLRRRISHLKNWTLCSMSAIESIRSTTPRRCLGMLASTF